METASCPNVLTRLRCNLAFPTSRDTAELSPTMSLQGIRDGDL